MASVASIRWVRFGENPNWKSYINGSIQSADQEHRSPLLKGITTTSVKTSRTSEFRVRLEMSERVGSTLRDEQTDERRRREAA